MVVEWKSVKMPFSLHTNGTSQVLGMAEIVTPSWKLLRNVRTLLPVSLVCNAESSQIVSRYRNRMP